MADSGWRRLSENIRGQSRWALICPACYAPVITALENGHPETQVDLLPQPGVRAVDAVNDIFLKRDDTCALCGAHPR